MQAYGMICINFAMFLRGNDPNSVEVIPRHIIPVRNDLTTTGMQHQRPAKGLFFPIDHRTTDRD